MQFVLCLVKIKKKIKTSVFIEPTIDFYIRAVIQKYLYYNRIHIFSLKPNSARA